MEWEEGPRWVQITDQLEERIRAGVYAPGERVPSIAEVAEEYQVSTSTAQKAFRGLRARGLTKTFSGMGSYVRRRSDEG
ncbi:winged helix-turn-helix domain-containing protein [Nocardiopsis sp. JB363]|uniref:winged helix-turn-helix domain-containing protein n=1 Tax=Nocardiopsis sp. JB363 TaxID=1434837 RepID=UPI00097B3CB8|nr:Transcriptional regulator KorSA, GntR family [Nocardiopsis sp. JB363]